MVLGRRALCLRTSERAVCLGLAEPGEGGRCGQGDWQDASRSPQPGQGAATGRDIWSRGKVHFI